MVPFPVILSDPWPRFQVHGVTIDAVDVLSAQLTRDLFAIAKFLSYIKRYDNIPTGTPPLTGASNAGEGRVLKVGTKS